MPDEIHTLKGLRNVLRYVEDDESELDGVEFHLRRARFLMDEGSPREVLEQLNAAITELEQARLARASRAAAPMTFEKFDADDLTVPTREEVSTAIAEVVRATQADWDACEHDKETTRFERDRARFALLALFDRAASPSPEPTTEEAKLVAFFRSPEGEVLGRQGDHDNLSPAETAIRALRAPSDARPALSEWPKASPDDTKKGWTFATKWLTEIVRAVQKDSYETVTMEQVESALLAAYRAAAPTGEKSDA